MDLLSLKTALVSMLNERGIDASVRDIERSKYSDLAFRGFRYKDRLDEVRSTFSSNEFVSSISVSGPYVNLTLNREKFASNLLSSILMGGSSFGRQPRKGKKVVLEHTSVNPTGPIHVGRFRNPVIGDSLRRILDFLGYDVVVHYYVNDVGRQVALIKLARDLGIPPDREVASRFQEYADKPDFQTFFVYVNAFKRSEEDPEFKKKIDEMMVKAERGDKSLLDGLRNTAEFCLEGQVESLKRAGFVYDKFVFESQFLKEGKVWQVIDQIKDRELAFHLENGALAVDLREFGSPREATILLRPDGTSVYLTRDVAYHLEKLDEGDLIINVLGEDHKVEFNELKALLNLLGKDTSNMEAVHFSFVSLSGRKMSTRRGETVPLDQVLDEGREKALRIIEEKNPELPEKEKVAEMVGVGALKWSLVRQDPMKKIDFKWEEALDFEGDTAPYIQYSIVRAKSIMRKKETPTDFSCIDLTDKEWSLVLSLSEFPEVVFKAGDQRKPNIIASYAYSLAKEFNEFYHSERVIGSDREDFRLALVSSVSSVLASALWLLGIDSPEQM